MQVLAIILRLPLSLVLGPNNTHLLIPQKQNAVKAEKLNYCGCGAKGKQVVSTDRALRKRPLEFTLLTEADGEAAVVRAGQIMQTQHQIVVSARKFGDVTQIQALAVIFYNSPTPSAHSQ